MLIGDLSENRLHILTEAHVQHFIRFIQNNHADVIQLDCMTAHMIHNTSRSAHDNLYAFQSYNLLRNLLTAVYRKYFDAMHIFCHLPQLLRRLNGKLTGGTQDDCLKFSKFRIHLLQNRYSKCCRLTGSRLSLTDYIVSL